MKTDLLYYGLFNSKTQLTVDICLFLRNGANKFVFNLLFYYVNILFLCTHLVRQMPNCFASNVSTSAFTSMFAISLIVEILV